MSFANQALACEWLATAAEIPSGIHRVPEHLDREIAELKLKSLDIIIDTLTEEQINYINSWNEGT